MSVCWRKYFYTNTWKRAIKYGKQNTEQTSKNSTTYLRNFKRFVIIKTELGNKKFDIKKYSSCNVILKLNNPFKFIFLTCLSFP